MKNLDFAAFNLMVADSVCDNQNLAAGMRMPAVVAAFVKNNVVKSGRAGFVRGIKNIRKPYFSGKIFRAEKISVSECKVVR